jgi:allophanate hydrolase subunit 2
VINLPNLITVRRAKDEIKRLQHYVNLAESYETKTLEKLIIKEYAFTNSLFEVTRNLNRRGYLFKGKLIEKDYVTAVINS